MASQSNRERDPNKDKALSLALGSIEKTYGKGAIMRPRPPSP